MYLLGIGIYSPSALELEQVSVPPNRSIGYNRRMYSTAYARPRCRKYDRHWQQRTNATAEIKLHGVVVSACSPCSTADEAPKNPDHLRLCFGLHACTSLSVSHGAVLLGGCGLAVVSGVASAKLERRRDAGKEEWFLWQTRWNLQCSQRAGWAGRRVRRSWPRH